MFFTRQFDYALRVMRALSKEKFLSVHEICAMEFIPQPYTYKILKKLIKASFVTSSRGAGGGYQLAKDPQDISLYDVYVAVEGEVYINECLQEGYTCPHIHNRPICLIHNEMRNIQNEFVSRLQQRSISSILELEKQ